MHPDTHISLINLGDFLWDKANKLKNCGNTNEAEIAFLEALELYEKSFGRDDPDFYNIVDDLASLMIENNDLIAAEKYLRWSLEGWNELYGSDSSEILEYVKKLVTTLKAISKTAEGVDLLRRYYSVSEQNKVELRYDLASCECLNGNTEEAKRLIAEHLKLHPEIKERALKDSDFEAIKDYIEKL